VDSIRNPYTPGAGARPHQLVGREAQLAAFDVALQRAQLWRPARSKILYGLRGVGKTVLLRELASHARNQRWIVISVEARAGEPLLPTLNREIFKELRNAGRTWTGDALHWARRVFTSFSLQADPGAGTYSFGLKVEPAAGYADSGHLDQDMAEMFDQLATLAGANGVGVLVTIDELQEVEPTTVGALNQTVHKLGQGGEPMPFLMVGAGLPSLQGILAEATSYAERLYEYWAIDRLSPDAVDAALVGPAQELGVSWEPAALERAREFSDGYPFFIQVLGKHAWDLSPGPDIGDSDVIDAIADARVDIDAGLYSARWQRATRAEQRLLRAIATCAPEGGPAKMAELVAEMGKTKISQLSPARSALISKGLVYAPNRGELAFTVPGMATFANRQVIV
jgi:hypothetical protein